MHRFLLIGTLSFACMAAASGLASAAETSADALALSVAVQTGAEAGPISASALAAAKRRLEAAEAAAPTAGADLAMWGLSAASAGPGASPSDGIRRFANGIIKRSASLALSLTRDAMRFIGTPYVFGGTSAGGFDCSGYVQHVFAMLGLRLPRTADAQYAAGRRISGSMRPGDLVFFQTYATGPSHVGIYLGHDRFIHSSSSMGVIVSSLRDSYWSARYLGAKRVVN